jgi:hypothetical protein
MGLASAQQLPNKETPESKWTFKKLLSPGAVAALTKIFVNPLEVILGYMILISGFSVLIGRNISPYFFVLTIFVLAAVVYERTFKKEDAKNKK